MQWGNGNVDSPDSSSNDIIEGPKSSSNSTKIQIDSDSEREIDFDTGADKDDIIIKIPLLHEDEAAVSRYKMAEEGRMIKICLKDDYKRFVW